MATKDPKPIDLGVPLNRTLIAVYDAAERAWREKQAVATALLAKAHAAEVVERDAAMRRANTAHAIALLNGCDQWWNGRHDIAATEAHVTRALREYRGEREAVDEEAAS